MRRRAIPLLVVLASGWLGALVFGGVLRDALIGPLLYAYWYGRLFVEAMPQGLLWGVFVVLALALLAAPWFRLVKDRPASRRRRTEAPMGEVAALAERFELSIRGGYFHRRLRQRLRDLTGRVLASRQRRSSERVRAELSQHPDQLPEAIRPMFTDDPPRPRLAFRLMRQNDLDAFAAAIDWLDRETDPSYDSRTSERGDLDRDDGRPE
jgi:membrane protein implicated in regulation of membrane protease activity